MQPLPGLAASPRRVRHPHGAGRGQRRPLSPASRLTHPSLCSGTPPLSQAPFGAFPRGACERSRCATAHRRPHQGSALHAGGGKGGRKRDAEGRLSEPLGERRGSRSLEAKGRLPLKPVPFPIPRRPPGGPRMGGLSRAKRVPGFVFFFGVRGGALPARPSEAKGEPIGNFSQISAYRCVRLRQYHQKTSRISGFR
jgi:hypothetical protein